MRVMRKKGGENTEFIRGLNVKSVNSAKIEQKEKAELEIQK